MHTPTAPLQRPLRTYRCPYIPKAPNGAVYAPNAEGIYPFVQIKAHSAIHALEQAHAVTGCPVLEAQRLEGAAA